MRFAKAHGTGNDFVVLPDPDGELDLTPAAVVALCDRRTGIGADGVLRVVRSAKDPDGAGMADVAEWFMDYRNSDGSLAEMCGNGVRVFARYLVEGGLAAPDGLTVATRAGVVTAEVGPDLIAVDMTGTAVRGVGRTAVDGRTYTGTVVTAGNPNLVITLPDEAALRAVDLSRPPLLAPADFPNSANVEFIVPATPIDGADAHVSMRVYERGAGETLSCGSGACAVAAAVIDAAGRDAGTVIVDVPGGRLTIVIGPGSCRLTGPAVIVATGETHLI
ncbi:MAG TPA: diaminopimelate epimerase [Micromonosporaceae bacterium]|jgi:diaminopimelate epimerase